MDVTKKCTKCGEEKEFDEFHKHIRGKLGLASTCKACSNLSKKTKRSNNFNGIKEKEFIYRANNREKLKAIKKKYLEKHPEKVKEKNKRNYALNKDKRILSAFTWSSNNKDKVKIASRKASKKASVKLTEDYIKTALYLQSLPITSETIKLKRLQLTIHRQIKHETNQ